MFIIEKHNEERPYQYGIFLTESKAIAQLEYLKTESDEYFIKEIPIYKFPLYVIDYFDHSEFCTKEEVKHIINEIIRTQAYLKLKDDDDHEEQMFIIELIEDEFAYEFDKLYGTPHWHCDKSFFKGYMRGGRNLDF